MAPQENSEPVLQKKQFPDLNQEEERALKAGMELASPLPGEEVVVSGMAGRFPNSDDIYQYRNNLFNKMDLVSADSRRWEPTHPEIPHRSGKIGFIEKFDAGFFGVQHRQAHAMDPMCRQVLERAIEAVMDAGYNPSQLRGSNTGVFVGSCFSETEKAWFYDNLESPSFGITGCNRSMQAQRISYILGLEGPAISIDTACSSSLFALEHGFKAIRTGRCDSAIVAGTNLCLHPIISLQFARLGVLSLDGSCKSFDADANGYARSETIAVVFLQKSKDARRIYAQILHAKSNCDGYKEQGITFPSGTMQKELLDEVYQECKVDPSEVDFLEAHATGTKVGDPEEIMAMDEVFCVNRKKPLLVGSIKSNLGHTEPASGMCSLVKVLLGMENDYLLPNINYTRPREGAEALEKGRIVVVTNVTPWPKGGSGIAAINSFGFGGANCHVVLKRFIKRKINNSEPRDELPRLVCISARTKEGAEHILEDIAGRPLDAEFVKILHEIFSKDISSYKYRGYTVISKSGELTRSIKSCDSVNRPLCLVFSGPSKKWLSIGNHLFKIPLFAATIQRIHEILAPQHVNIMEIISEESCNDPTSILLGNVAIQIAFIDILNNLEISCDYYIGYSIGELVAAYADNALTLEQVLLVTYQIGQCLSGVKTLDSVVYQVEENQNDGNQSFKSNSLWSVLDNFQLCWSIIPNDLEIIGYNSNNGYTIAGPTQKATQFINSLKNQVGVSKEIVDNFGLHTRSLQQLRPKLLQILKKVICTPKHRSSKWISTSTNGGQLTDELFKDASAEYFVNSVLSPVFMKEAVSKLPTESLLLEIGQKIVKFDDLDTVNLVSIENNETDVISSFLCGLGSIHEFNYNLQLDKLYPEINWPVSSNTPMVSPLIKWDYTENWFVSLYKAQEAMQSGERIIAFRARETDWAFMTGHIIDGRNLLPATGYLVMVWETLSMMVGVLTSDTQVVFENIKFHRATNVSRNRSVELVIMVNKGTGQFEVADMGHSVVTGRVYIPEHISQGCLSLPVSTEEIDPIRLQTKDIYKELRLRGYNYMGPFRGLKDCDLSASKGFIEWTGNWITFIDSMLQIKILQEDTRNLYVPTGIERLEIDAKAHVGYSKQFGKNPSLPVYVHKESGIIKSGFIELRGLHASFIPRRKPLGDPVLEAHKFIPFEAAMPIDKAIRVQTQIFLENNYGIKIRVVELVDEATEEGLLPLGPLIHQALSDQPLMQPEIIVLSNEPLELTNVSVEDKKLTTENHTCSIVVASRICSRPEVKLQVLNALKENGVVISREDKNFIAQEHSGLDILAVYQNDKEKIVMLRRAVEFVPPTVIDISLNFDWLPTLQNAVKTDSKVILVGQNSPLSGIMGFVNCLRREPGGLNIKCVFIVDFDAPKFDMYNKFYSKQLKKGLAVNVYKGGNWGTYRHLLLEAAPLAQQQHVYNNVLVRGDLSSLRWIEGPLSTKTILPTEKTLVHVYYSSINFRDVMTASGRISADFITRDRLEQSLVQGFEFAGRDTSGKRVMGMITSGALSSMVAADPYLLLEIPEYMSMEDAATIPITYATALKGLIGIANIQPGKSILIHAGSGGVGQSAINIALYYKCNIFTTVGTEEKREFIKKTFPEIPETHIGNSRDTSFETMIFTQTSGRGVDIVLNSLAEEKLLASVRCLAPGGTFLEIGKFDLASNHPIGLDAFTEGRTFYGVMLDSYFLGSPVVKCGFAKLINEGLKSGMVKPLNKTIFKEDEVEQAFRYMAGGKHIGKVMIKLRDEETENCLLPDTKLFAGLARFYAKPDMTYIIGGGLGGFGLELTDWLVIRGAKKIILSSRSGLKTGYQASRIRIWKSYGVTIVVSTADITIEEGCLALIKEAMDLGPVEAIFNLAVVLKDAILENQNKESYLTSLGPKAFATKHLDVVSRKLCPQLLYFVVFSSVVCGRGNAGQTNYGMSNSIMERICENRKKDGYPALAIQWGAIGEVGLVAEMHELSTEIEIGGTLQQRISSCLDVMDVFLKQDEPIVSSIVVAEKRGWAGGADNIVDVVKSILGLRDLKTVSLHSSLSELGMDSMMAVEIKQTLEREYEVFLTAQDIRSMTFARLKEIANEKAAENENQKVVVEENDKMPGGVQMLLRYIGDDESSSTPIIRLASLIKEKTVAPKVFLLPGIEGMTRLLEPLASNLTSHAYCLQFTHKDEPESTIEELAKFILPRIQENLPKSTPFSLVAYSYGCVVAMEVAALLEADGRIGRIILIDGAPYMFKELIKQQVPEVNSEPLLQTLILCVLMQLYIPIETVLKNRDNIYNCETLDERISIVLSLAPEGMSQSEKYIKQVCLASYLRIKSVLLYQPKFPKLKSMVKLFTPSRPTIQNYDEDYRVQELCENPVEVTTYEGNHLTILKNPQVAYTINTIIDTSSEYFKQSTLQDKVDVETLKEVSLKQM